MLMLAVTWSLASLAPWSSVRSPAQEAATATVTAVQERLAGYEMRRLAAESALERGEAMAVVDDLVALQESVDGDGDVARWYAVEVGAMTGTALYIAELDAEARESLLAAVTLHPASGQDSERALDELLAAADVVAEVLGPGDALLAQRFFDLSTLASQLGRWDDSVAFAREALAVAEVLGEERPVQVAKRRMWLGWMLRRIGEPAEAERQIVQAREALERLDVKSLGVFVEIRLHATNYLGVLYSEQKRFAEAEPLLREYTSECRSQLGDTSRPYLGGLNNLALFLAGIGDMPSAVAIQAECVAKGSQALDASSPILAQLWFNYGTHLLAAGQLREAEEALLRAVDLIEALGLRREIIVLSKVRLSQIARARGDLDGWLRWVESAAADDAVATLVPADRAQLNEGLIWALVGSDELERARDVLDRCTELERQYPSWSHRVEMFRAVVLEGEGRTELARAAYRAAARDLSASEPVGSGFTTAVHTWRAGLEWKAGDLAAARAALTKAVEHYEEGRSVLVPGYQRSQFQFSPYSRLALVEFERADPLAAWNALESWRARALLELLTTDDSERMVAVEREMAAIEAQSKALRDGALGASAAQVGERLKRLEQRKLALQGQQASESNRDAIRRRTLAEVQRALRADEAYVGWFALDWKGSARAHAWVLRREGPPRAVALELDGEAHPFGQRLSAFAERLAAEAHSAFVPDPNVVVSDAESLGGWLFGGLLEEGWLDGVEHIVISGATPGVPFEALRVGGEWVGERWTVSHAPSCAVHAVLRERPRPPLRRRAALILGDPPFRAEHAGGDDAVSLRGEPAGAGPPLHLADSLANLERLTHSRAEAKIVAATFERSTVMVGADASEDNLERLALEGTLQSFSVVHIASHALIDDHEPGRSGVALSQVGLRDPLTAALRGETVSDGYLTANEIVSGWQLDGELVTLSACRSALGFPLHGEGHIGLTTAFLRAGARSVLASQWSVQDEPTMLFMDAYYRALRDASGERPKVTALRAARAALRSFERDGERPFAHPAYWAAFILIGDPD